MGSGEGLKSSTNDKNDESEKWSPPKWEFPDAPIKKDDENIARIEVFDSEKGETHIVAKNNGGIDSAYTTPVDTSPNEIKSLYGGYVHKGNVKRAAIFGQQEQLAEGNPSINRYDFETGKMHRDLDPTKVVDKAIEKAKKMRPSFLISSNPDNKEQKIFKVVNPKNGKVAKTGVFEMGEEWVSLPDGEYVHEGALMDAFHDYMFSTELTPPSPIEIVSPEKFPDFSAKDLIEKRLKNVAVLVGVVAAAVITAISSTDKSNVKDVRALGNQPPAIYSETPEDFYEKANTGYDSLEHGEPDMEIAFEEVNEAGPSETPPEASFEMPPDFMPPDTPPNHIPPNSNTSEDHIYNTDNVELGHGSEELNGGELDEPTNVVDKWLARGEVESLIDETPKPINGTPRQNAIDTLNKAKIGDQIEIPSGVVVYASSDHAYGGDDTSEVIGNVDNLPPGKYDVQAFSVLDPETHEVISDNVIWEGEEDLGRYLEEISRKTNHPVNDLYENVKIHVAREGVDIGWADYNDIIDKISTEGIGE